MREEPTVVEVAKGVVDCLEADGIAYAIGGAIACGYWAPPRATVDVDITLFVEEEQWANALGTLQKAGCSIDEHQAMASLRERGDFRTSVSGYRIDVYVPSFDFYDSARQRLVRRPLAGRPVWILSAEDLVVFKMLYFRGKDIEDVRRILLLQERNFNREYVASWLAKLIGQDDERMKRWSSLVADPAAG